MLSTTDLHRHQSHPPSSPSSASVRQKRLKAGTACTNCRRKKLRCSGTPLCVRCVTHKLDCVVDETLFQKSSSTAKSYPRQPRVPRRPKATKNTASNHHPYYSSHTSAQQQQHRQHHHHRVSTSSFEDLMESDELDFQSDRRMSVSSSTSLSDLSPSPSASPRYTYDHFQCSGNPLHVVSLSDSNVSPPHHKQRKYSTIPHPLDTYQHQQQRYRPLSPSASSRSSASSFDTSSHPLRKRASHDQGSPSRTKQLRRQDSNPDEGTLSPPLTPQRDQPNAASSGSGAAVSAATGVTNKETELKDKKNLKSVVSTISLDGHGQQ